MLQGQIQFLQQCKVNQKVDISNSFSLKCQSNDYPHKGSSGTPSDNASSIAGISQL